MIFPLVRAKKNQALRQPGDLGVLTTNVAEEARTRGFASPALAGFAFVKAIMERRKSQSIL
jgi:hypothetical protein